MTDLDKVPVMMKMGTFRGIPVWLDMSDVDPLMRDEEYAAIAELAAAVFGLYEEEA